MIITRYLTRTSAFFAVWLCLVASVILPTMAQDVVQIRGPKNATEDYSGIVYGPVKSDDTLWRIAGRYRLNQTLSIYQIMEGIYRLNPDSFEQQNLNLMVDGAMLRLPSERYVQRIDAAAAKRRAEQDEQSWQQANQTGEPLVSNIKPVSPPVNQADLASTKDALEAKLNNLDQTQTQQFESLRDQFAESITNVETLLENNQKLYERIEQVNTDLSALRFQVEGDVQGQMTQQSGQIEEMLSLMRQEQQAKEMEQQTSIVELLSSTTSLIVLSSLLTVSLLTAVGVWLLKRRGAPEQPAVEKVAKEISAESAIDVGAQDDLLTDPLDEVDDLTDDDLFNDDDLLDDVLSSELEESLDDELQNFADLSDEMLVPDSEKGTDSDSTDSLFDEGDTELSNDELDNLFDTDVADADIAEEAEGIDISTEDDDDLLDSLADEADAEHLDGLLDQDTMPDLADEHDDVGDEEIVDDLADSFEGAPEDTSDDALDTITEDSPDEVMVDAIEPAEDAAPEKPEISIDELLEETEQESTFVEQLEEDSAELNEDMLAKIDDEIQQQGQELDKLTDNIIGEIEQLEMMGDMLGAFDDSDDDEPEVISVPEGASGDLQDLDALAEDLEDIQVDDMANADDFADPLSDDLLAELQGSSDAGDGLTDSLDDPLLNALEDETLADTLDELDSLDALDDSEDEAQALSDELLEELQQETAEQDSVNDSISDELISELEQSVEAEESAGDELADELLEELQQTSEQQDSVNDALSDELLDELEQSVDEQQTASEALSDELLEELAQELESEPASEEVDKQADESLIDEVSIDDLLDEMQSESIQPEVEHDELDDALLEPEARDALGDELLEELEQEFESDPVSEGDDNQVDEALIDEEPIDEVSIGEVSIDEVLDEIQPDPIQPEVVDDEFEEGELTQEFETTELESDFDPAEIAAVNEGLADVPELDDWLGDDANSPDTAILDELENTDFDELLSAIDNDAGSSAETSVDKPSLGNPDLDLDALLNDIDDIQQEGTSSGEATSEDGFVSVEDLIEDAEHDESAPSSDDFDLDVSLEAFTGLVDDQDMIDVDLDGEPAANLDLARTYIDMDDFSAARSLLNEVLEQGSPLQIEEAKALLKEMGEG